VIERAIKKVVQGNGSIPYDDWYESLRDIYLRAAVAARIARVRAGNFGDHKPVGEGVNELRINKGPGLRVYYGEHGTNIVLLLGGGDKSTQQRDIKNAIDLWKQWKQLTKK
jgi:putative addiction module killer protein